MRSYRGVPAGKPPDQEICPEKSSPKYFASIVVGAVREFPRRQILKEAVMPALVYRELAWAFAILIGSWILLTPRGPFPLWDPGPVATAIVGIAGIALGIAGFVLGRRPSNAVVRQ
jgi:hypothetical protein